jgi:hypothetical protein
VSSSRRKAANAANVLIGVVLGAFALIGAGAGANLGGPAGLAIGLASIGLWAWIFVRSARMAVLADAEGITVRNLGRTYEMPWETVSSVEVGGSDNVTGAVSTLKVRRIDGSTVVGRGASSYSRRKVEGWRDLVLSARPGV